ncbi:hypothetical protein C8J57DRAFT_1233081 [Mycena rebaudengoi]|nr:hypothetical protein C8J57DRAFT_1233081 [Mycena rebaudengoi]
MAPTSWATLDQRAWLKSWLPRYQVAQAGKTLYQFWAKIREEWLAQYPEEQALGFPVPDAQVDPEAGPLLTVEQEELLSAALLKRKNQLQAWFRNETSKVKRSGRGTGTAPRDSLAGLLFKAKAKRRWCHQVLEIYHKHNPEQVKERSAERGFDKLNEATQACDEEGEWLDDDDGEARLVRVRDARVARLTLMQAMVKEMFEEETPETQDMYCKAAREEVFPVEEETPDGVMRRPEEYQASIDESGEVIRMFHDMLFKMTGWMGATVYGGPMPNMGGDLAVKTITFGLTPGGVNFEHWHPSWQKLVSKPLLTYLRRAFPPNVRLERTIFSPAGEDSTSAQDAPAGEEGQAEEEAIPPQENPAKPTRRLRKKDKNKCSGGKKAAPTSTPAMDLAPATLSDQASASTPTSTGAVAGDVSDIADVPQIRNALPVDGPDRNASVYGHIEDSGLLYSSLDADLDRGLDLGGTQVPDWPGGFPSSPSLDPSFDSDPSFSDSNSAFDSSHFDISMLFDAPSSESPFDPVAFELYTSSLESHPPTVDSSKSNPESRASTPHSSLGPDPDCPDGRSPFFSMAPTPSGIIWPSSYINPCHPALLEFAYTPVAALIDVGDGPNSLRHRLDLLIYKPTSGAWAQPTYPSRKFCGCAFCVDGGGSAAVGAKQFCGAAGGLFTAEISTPHRIMGRVPADTTDTRNICASNGKRRATSDTDCRDPPAANLSDKLATDDAIYWDLPTPTADYYNTPITSATEYCDPPATNDTIYWEPPTDCCNTPVPSAASATEHRVPPTTNITPAAEYCDPPATNDTIYWEPPTDCCNAPVPSAAEHRVPPTTNTTPAADYDDEATSNADSLAYSDSDGPNDPRSRTPPAIARKARGAVGMKPASTPSTSGGSSATASPLAQASSGGELLKMSNSVVPPTESIDFPTAWPAPNVPGAKQVARAAKVREVKAAKAQDVARAKEAAKVRAAKAKAEAKVRAESMGKELDVEIRPPVKAKSAPQPPPANVESGSGRPKWTINPPLNDNQERVSVREVKWTQEVKHEKAPPQVNQNGGKRRGENLEPARRKRVKA